MENDYLMHWEYDYPKSLIQRIELDIANAESGNSLSLESTSDITQLEVVSSKPEDLIARRNSPTTSTSTQNNLEEHYLSNNSRPQPYDDATGTLSPDTVENNDIIDNSSDVIDPQIEKSGKSRKRTWNPSKWKSIESKRAKNSGNSGVSLRGKEFQRRALGTGCNEDYRFKCHTKINRDQRQNVFDDFWNLADHTRQWDYIARLMVFENGDLNENSDSNKKTRSKRQYMLPIDKDMVRVCKSMFTGTLGNVLFSSGNELNIGIVGQWIQTVRRKKMTSSSTSIIQDLRGRHTNRPTRIPETITQSVKAHIQLFPRVESHYCRGSTQAEYPEQGLNFATMYRLYTDWMRSKNENSMASEDHYRSVFNYSHNLRFHIPKKDQCDVCSQYEFSTGLKKANLEEDYRRHQKNKSIARKLKEDDKKKAVNNSGVLVACFDLQKVLSTPKAETSVMHPEKCVPYI